MECRCRDAVSCRTRMEKPRPTYAWHCFRPYNKKLVQPIKTAGNYQLGAALSGNIYKQSNDVDLYNEQGGAAQYVMTGLGTHYKRFSGFASDVNYTGSGSTLLLSAQPLTQRGFYGDIMLESSRYKTYQQPIQLVTAHNVIQQQCSYNRRLQKQGCNKPMDNIRTLRFRLQTRRRTRCRRCHCRCLSCIGRPYNVQALPHYGIRRCNVYCSFKKSMDYQSKVGLHFQPFKICLSEQKNKLFAHLHRSYHTVVVAHWQTLAYRLPN